MWIFILKALGYVAVGFVEMFLATQRTAWISKGRSLEAALLVFFEDFIAFFIIYQVSQGLFNSWPLIVAYAIGNSFGTYINLKKCSF